MAAVQETVDRVRRIDVDQYRYGFETVIESDKAPKGLSEDTIRFISAKKNEPAWMLEWRLGGLRPWRTLVGPQRGGGGGLSPLADHGRAEMGAGRLSQDRLSGSLLLFGAEAEEDDRLARRGRSGNPENLREARPPPARG